MGGLLNISNIIAVAFLQFGIDTTHESRKVAAGIIVRRMSRNNREFCIIRFNYCEVLLFLPADFHIRRCFSLRWDMSMTHNVPNQNRHLTWALLLRATKHPLDDNTATQLWLGSNAFPLTILLANTWRTISLGYGILNAVVEKKTFWKEHVSCVPVALVGRSSWFSAPCTDHKRDFMQTEMSDQTW